MKSILLMRHSYAEANNSAWTDRDRPLTEHGRAIARTTADALQAHPISRIIASSAARALETAQIVAAAMGMTCQAADALYLARPLAYFEHAVELAGDDDDSILVVGHNPGIATLICTWFGTGLAVSPCTVARFEASPQAWPDFADSCPQLTDLYSDGIRQEPA